MQLYCAKCGRELDTDADAVMPDPQGKGDLCWECYEKALYDADLAQGTATIQRSLPTMPEFMAVYCRHSKLPLSGPEILESNCHAAAVVLAAWLKTRGLDARVRRGHWLGPDVRAARSERFGQQHSWLALRLPDNPIEFILDPTQFVFLGTPANIAISTEDDQRYDVGGYTLREIAMGKPQMPDRQGETKPSNLSRRPQKRIAGIYGRRDWSQWTLIEMKTIANTRPTTLGGCAKEIFSNIIQAGMSGLIPIDARHEIMQEQC